MSEQDVEKWVKQRFRVTGDARPDEAKIISVKKM
jgi:hypothetical protein